MIKIIAIAIMKKFLMMIIIIKVMIKIEFQSFKFCKIYNYE